MDYGRLNRRELQALCKEHGIPANKTNVFMAEALGALLNAPKANHELVEEPIPDPTDLVKEIRSKRAVKSKTSTRTVAENEVDDLSSHLAQSSLTCSSTALDKVEPAKENNSVVKVDESMDDDSLDVVNVTPCEHTDTTKLTRKARTQSSRRGANSTRALADTAGDSGVTSNSEANVVITMDVEPTALGTTEMVQEIQEPELRPLVSTYSRRGPKKQEDVQDPSATIAAAPVSTGIPESVVPETVHVQDAPSDVILPPLGHSTVDVKTLAKKSKVKVKRSTKVITINSTTTEEDSPPETKITAEVPQAVLASLSSTPENENRPIPSGAEIISQVPLQEPVAVEVLLAKKSKAKGKRSKKVKPASPAIANIEREIAVTSRGLFASDTSNREACQYPDSPAFGLASGLAQPEYTTQEILSAASDGPTPHDEDFEFQAFPSSIVEIMSPRPQELVVPLTNVCQHRAGRKSGLACLSCASEKKVATLMQDMLLSIDIPEVQVRPHMSAMEENTLVASPQATSTTKIVTTPLKQDDDKENSLNKVDLNSLSIRKLQKEVQRRGLSKRNNTRSAKV